MRNTSRSAVHRSLCSLLATVALLAQVVVPHVHGRAAHRESAIGTQVVSAPDGCVAWDAAGAESERDADRHGTSCPLCRAQTDARSLLLPAVFAMPAPVAALSPFACDLAVARSRASRSLAAPRAPPAVS